MLSLMSRPGIGSVIWSGPSRPTARRICGSPLGFRIMPGPAPTGAPRRGEDEEGPSRVVGPEYGAERKGIETVHFTEGKAIAQRHARPGDRTDEGQVVLFPRDRKGDWPHRVESRGPAALELSRTGPDDSTVRLHASIGYVTPDDEHHGRGPAIRRARTAGMRRAQAERIKEN